MRPAGWKVNIQQGDLSKSEELYVSVPSATTVVKAQDTAEDSDGAIALRDVIPANVDHQIVNVAGFMVPLAHPSILFGDGGAAKSLLALYLAGRMAEHGHRVLLADWELEAQDHRIRFGHLFGDTLPAAVYYTRCARPLTRDIDRLRRIIRRYAIDYAICDSVGFATHEAPETSASALAYFQAVRQLGIGTMSVAHINRSDTGDQKPYGSAFFHNSARATWFVKATESSAGVTLGIFNRKNNLGERQAPFALNVTFGDRVIIRPAEIASVEHLRQQVPLRQRLHVLLRGGARSRTEIVEEFDDVKADSIRRTLDREIKARRIIKLPDQAGTERYGVAVRQS
jgi:hypothetical protein